MKELQSKKKALLSVYNKTDIVEFANGLIGYGYEIYASGGTAKALEDGGVSVIDVASLVGGGQILGHRVVTLSREISAGLLAKYNDEDDVAEMESLAIPYLDLVCCDFYPLKQKLQESGVTKDDVVETIDIGGPTMIKAAAKGGRIVICDFEDREKVLDWMLEGRRNEETFIDYMRKKAFQEVAEYYAAAAVYFSKGDNVSVFGKQCTRLKYGENPQQENAELYVVDPDNPWGVHQLKKVSQTPFQGMINTTDASSLISIYKDVVRSFYKNNDQIALLREMKHVAIGVKHGNACGAAVAETAAEALTNMIMGDHRAIYGGCILIDVQIDEELAKVILKAGQAGKAKNYFNVIIAASFTAKAKELLTYKTTVCHLFELEALRAPFAHTDYPESRQMVPVNGGFILQDPNSFVMDFQCETYSQHGGPAGGGYAIDILIGVAVARNSNSNTIVLVRDGMLLGNGAGQQDRVGAAELAIKRATDAGHSDLTNAVAVSDSFFPFPDGPQVLIDAGVGLIFATSGSKRDEEVIELCKNSGVTLVMMSDRKARMFSKHVG